MIELVFFFILYHVFFWCSFTSPRCRRDILDGDFVSCSYWCSFTSPRCRRDILDGDFVSCQGFTIFIY